MLIQSPGLFKHQNIFQACVVLPSHMFKTITGIYPKGCLLKGLVVEVKVSNPVYHPYDALNTARVMQGKGKNTEQDKP